MRRRNPDYHTSLSILTILKVIVLLGARTLWEDYKRVGMKVSLRLDVQRHTGGRLPEQPEEAEKCLMILLHLGIFIHSTIHFKIYKKFYFDFVSPVSCYSDGGQDRTEQHQPAGMGQFWWERPGPVQVPTTSKQSVPTVSSPLLPSQTSDDLPISLLAKCFLFIRT